MRFYRNKDGGDVLTEGEARKEWRELYDGDDPTNLLSFYDQYEEVKGREAVLADIDHVIATHAPADKFKYQLLDRLRCDCDYFLGNGNRYAPHLWAGDVETHLESMKKLYYSFPETGRPEWITAEDLERYAERMKPQKGAAK